MSLKDALRKFSESAKEFTTALSKKFSGNDQAEKVVSEKAEDLAVEKLKPIIRAMLSTNLISSGIGRVSGQLEEAVDSCDVWFEPKKSRIYVGFRSGMKESASTGKMGPSRKPSKKSKNKVGMSRGTSVYVYGSALNYGAVRQPRHTRPIVSNIRTGAIVTQKVRYGKRGVLGKSAAKSLKRAILNKDFRARAEARLNSKGYSQFSGGIDKGKSISVSGKITIIKPRPFFYLTSVQEKAVQVLFAKYYREITANSEKGKQ